MMTKEQATELGQAALRRIKNKPAWTLEVHENLGWHWTLVSCEGFFTLHGGYNGERQYSCLLSDSKHKHCGSMLWHDTKRFSDPNKAIAHTVNLARTVTNRLVKRVSMAESVLCPSQPKPAMRPRRAIGGAKKPILDADMLITDEQSLFQSKAVADWCFEP